MNLGNCFHLARERTCPTWASNKTISCSSSSIAFPHSLPPSSKKQNPSNLLPPKRLPTVRISSLRIGVEEIAELAHNKVLVAATLASAIGQLSKPLTSAMKGKGVDLMAAVGSGGMPSTHSAGVVAAATSLGLERGFSDPIFGVSVVFAAIVMYDAQGVRKEAGYHAKILNKILKVHKKSTLYQEEDDLTDCLAGKSSINSENLVPLPQSEKANCYPSNPESYTFQISRISSKFGLMRSLTSDGHILNESIGHTETQVLVGALLGFVVSLALDTVL